MIMFGAVCDQGRIQGGDLGVKTPPSMEIFFNLLGFYENITP